MVTRLELPECEPLHIRLAEAAIIIFHLSCSVLRGPCRVIGEDLIVKTKPNCRPLTTEAGFGNRTHGSTRSTYSR